MTELIDRMIRCGIPSKTAHCIANDFKHRDRLDALTIYVLLAEAENGKH